VNNTVLQLKVKERLNKLDSKDYDNLECWQIVEAYNKASVEWSRRQLVGSNILKQGDEQSKRRVDDLQVLLTTVPLSLSAVKLYTESDLLPVNYLEFKRLEVYASKDCCKDPRLMTIYLSEEANAINSLKDDNKKPSFEWGETFTTLVGNRVRIYTNDDFVVDSAKLMYYKQPNKIQVAGCTDPNTGAVSSVDVESEFKEDVIEIIIDAACAIIAGDIENMTQYQRNSQNSEKNN
jgi:hypothetical protein